MNNVSLVIWRFSILGLRASPPYERILSLFSSSQLLNPSPIFSIPVSRRPISSLARWSTRRARCLGRNTDADGYISRHTALSLPTGQGVLFTPKSTLPNSPTRGTRFRSATASQPKKVVKPLVYLIKPLKELGSLSRKRVGEILGPRVITATGKRLLQQLQLQRETGTLDKGIQEPDVDEVLVAKALSWLRDAYPLNEDAAIIRRIEEEDEVFAKAEQTGLYRPQQGADPENPYGNSGLDAIKVHFENSRAKSQSENSTQIVVDPSNPNSALVQQPAGRAVLARRSESAEWVKRYKEKAKLEGLVFDKLQPLQKVRRLLPSALFCLAVVWFCVLLAQNYTPPPRQARILPDIPPAAATIMAIIGLNVFGFILWRLPPMWRFMNTFFLIIPAKPRIWSILGNVFSHQSPMHLLGNMGVLWLVGTRLHDDIGRGNFLAIYLCSGVLASFVSLSRFVIMNNLTTTSLGASGALTGVLAAWCSIHAGEQFKFRFLPPELGPVFSLNLLFLILISGEIFGIYRGINRIDHWAHLGGYATGFMGAMAMKHRARRRRLLDSGRGDKSSVVAKEQLQGSQNMV